MLSTQHYEMASEFPADSKALPEFCWNVSSGRCTNFGTTERSKLGQSVPNGSEARAVRLPTLCNGKFTLLLIILALS